MNAISTELQSLLIQRERDYSSRLQMQVGWNVRV